MIGSSSEKLTATESSNTTLTNTSLSVSGGTTLSLTGFKTATLTMSSSSGSSSYLDASAFSLGATSLTAIGGGNVVLHGGTAGQDTLTAAGSGDDILIGDGAGDDLTDSGTGMNILIGGGGGGDTLTGNGNDILVSGATKYDSNTSPNIAALDAILAEWTSNDTFAARISKISSGVGMGNVDALNSGTITQDAKANTLQDGTSQSRYENWFLGWKNDTVKKNNGETETTL